MDTRKKIENNDCDLEDRIIDDVNVNKTSRVEINGDRMNEIHELIKSST